MAKYIYKELKAWTEKVLKKYELARNSDQWLTYKLYCDEFPNRVKSLPEGKAFLCEDLVTLPDPQTITRIRRKFNENGLYKSTDPEVIKARAKKEKKIKEEIVYGMALNQH